MVRNFTILNNRPLRPTRVWMKNTGLPSRKRITSEMAAKTGSSSTSPIKDNILSNRYLVKFCILIFRAVKVMKTMGILTEIPYPSFAAENRETGVVHLVFCIGTDGKVMVKQISGDNDFLMGYVEKKLGQILFEPQTETSKEYTISLDFRLK